MIALGTMGRVHTNLALTFEGNPIIYKGIQNFSNARLEKGAIQSNCPQE